MLVDKQAYFEVHHYLQNKLYLRKNYNILLLDYLFFFSISKCFVLFEVICLLKLGSLLSN